jgi:hypothetical protein
MGAGWLDTMTQKCLCQVVDLSVIKGVKYKFNRLHLPAYIDFLLKIWHEKLIRTRYAFIEDQIVPTGDRNVLEFCVMMELTLKYRYPNIDVYRVRPQNLRDALDIGGAGGRDAGKLRSAVYFTRLISREDFDRCRHAFIKRISSKKSVLPPDGLEAALLAIYGYHCLPDVIAARNPPLNRKRVATDGYLECLVQLTQKDIPFRKRAKKIICDDEAE